MEFRPWPKSYNIPNPNFPISDTYYFGIRIKKNDSGMQVRVDLTETIKIFYKNLKEKWISQDEKLMELIVKKQADIQVNYKRREQLPDEVRPKDAGL